MFFACCGIGRNYVCQNSGGGPGKATNKKGTNKHPSKKGNWFEDDVAEDVRKVVFA